MTGGIETLDWVIAQDVEVIDVGHYTPATIGNARALRAYMIDLHQQVLDSSARGNPGTSSTEMSDLALRSEDGLASTRCTH